jgi:glycosyltransferase involved in cell wall biosynthesis
LYFKVFSFKFNPTKDIVYLEILPKNGAGFQYRVAKWRELLMKNNSELKIDTFTLIEDNNEFYKAIYADKSEKLLIDTLRLRIKQLEKVRDYKVVIVRRSIILYNDYGNLFLEKFLNLIHPSVILDFDDDIATTHSNQQHKNLFQKILLESKNHFNESLNVYSNFIVGSNYLKKCVLDRKTEAKEENIVVIPTCVDYDRISKNYDCNKTKITFGWIGGNYNLMLLEPLIPVLNNIYAKHDIELLIIAGVESYPFENNFPIQYMKYNLDSEIDALLLIDIGLMPLHDDLTNRGKCGFKLIQYMGLGIPGVASAITINNEIIDHQENGWLVYSEAEWENTLLEVIQKKRQFTEMGKKAKMKVDKKYSFLANYDVYFRFVTKFL